MYSLSSNSFSLISALDLAQLQLAIRTHTMNWSFEHIHLKHTYQYSIFNAPEGRKRTRELSRKNKKHFVLFVLWYIKPKLEKNGWKVDEMEKPVAPKTEFLLQLFYFFFKWDGIGATVLSILGLMCSSGTLVYFSQFFHPQIDSSLFFFVSHILPKVLNILCKFFQNWSEAFELWFILHKILWEARNVW